MAISFLILCSTVAAVIAVAVVVAANFAVAAVAVAAVVVAAVIAVAVNWLAGLCLRCCVSIFH